MTLDIRSAAVVLECARHGSLGRAAAALNMTQPAVTRMLKRLEDGLGVPLFTRTTRGVLPTVYGEAVIPYAELLVSEIGNAEDVIRQMKGASRGLVRIGGVGSVVGRLVAAIARMRTSHPEVQFQIVEELEDQLLDSLKAGAVDLAVSPEPYVDDEIALATPEVLSDEVGAFARAGHPALARPALAALAQAAWAMPPGQTPVVREWLRRFHAAGLEPRAPVLVSRSVPAIKAAVAGADLLCWLPLPLVADEVARGDFRRIGCPDLGWSRTFRIWRRKKGLMTPPAQALIRHLRQEAEAEG